MKTGFCSRDTAKFTAVFLVILAVMMLALPAQKAEASVVAELPDEPMNSFEARLEQYEFKSYDEIIGLLEGDEAYALVKVLGKDEEVLLLAETMYETEEGQIYATQATPYTMKSTGKVTADSLLFSDGPDTPIALDENGIICCASPTSIEKQCYGENGSPNKGLMLLEYIYVLQYDKNGNPAAVSGFFRTTNNLVNDDRTDIEDNDLAAFEQARSDYDAAEPIVFTAASAVSLGTNGNSQK